MDHRTAIALAIGIVVTTGVVAGALVTATPDESPSDATENTASTMETTEFDWGTVTHETDSETDETHVEVTVEGEGDVSISAMAASDATHDRPDEVTDADRDAETETFPWGAVIHSTDPDTGETDIEVLVDADDDVSLSVTTVSEDGTQSTSTAIVTAAGEAGESGEAGGVGEAGEAGEPGEAGANVSISQSTTVSSGTSISIDDEREDD
ncbi:hypothetical protein [Halosolutus halophilus]|uniref:hypothetical protein n=1 Tax=Halosolutus halophilus TaxID=1552990 RepID=UPI00223525A6|nr:hypothetical protein [Halosolutus halophilus]